MAVASTRSALTTELTAIRGEATAGGNTKGRIADAIEGSFQSAAKLFRIIRSNATENVAPTAAEVADAHINYFAEVSLTDGKLEFWSHNGTSWSKNFVRSDGGNAIAPAWSASTAVIQDEVVTFENRLWKSNSARTTGSSFDASEQTNWTLLDHQVIKAWPASKAVYVGEVVVQSNQLYRSNSSRTTGGTWNTTEESNWTLLSETTLTAPDWAAATERTAGPGGKALEKQLSQNDCCRVYINRRRKLDRSVIRLQHSFGLDRIDSGARQRDPEARQCGLPLKFCSNNEYSI
jgi:hypothetical protein